MTDAATAIWPDGPEEQRLLRSMDGGVQARCAVLRPDRYGFFRTAIDGAPSIARGAGQSFAAASFGAGAKSVELGAFDRVLDYDSVAGEVEVDSGITLAALFRFLASRGRYLPVQPGHAAATVGGCIACDVHGGNPAKDGTFIAQVRSLRLFHPDHGMVVLSDNAEPDLFRATCGGFGLTGIIVAATLRTRVAPGWNSETTIHRVSDIGEATGLLQRISASADFAHARLDCASPRVATLGRGLVLDIRITAGGAPQTAPPPPSHRGIPENRWAARVAEFFRFHHDRRADARQQGSLAGTLFPGSYPPGPDGLHSYQALLPDERVADCVPALRDLATRHDVRITRAALSAFAGRGDLLRLDGDGVALAFDVPRGRTSRAFLAEFDEFVVTAGGRPNIGRDSRLPREVVEATYPECDRFRAIRQAWDPRRRFVSELSKRLAL